MSVVPLIEADAACGRKAYALATLMRAGLPVPDGFVVTDPATDPGRISASLRRLAARAVAVRSSGRTEDSGTVSYAGQLETVLGARVVDDVLAAIGRCAASAGTQRARAYQTHLDLDGEARVPVIVQELVEADHAGVLFTRDPRTGDDTVVINASWGLGESVVSGTVVPDEVTVTPPADTVRVTIGTKQTRLDLSDQGLVGSPVAEPDRVRGCLTVGGIERLVALGRRCEALFGRPQDVEWAAADGQIWLVQSRPITTLQASRTPAGDAGSGHVLATGVPSSPGQALGPARLVRSVDGFSRVRRGDILVCRTTDPAWTPLFRLAAGVVTETGGILSHAAIVAREYGIPAVAGARDALRRIPDGSPITIDGARGTITARPS
ncbi:PEP/pyruvate-binding domain-containing protein [Micromonospora sp. KC721]|uniref:PEP/pyruvate-binding domain-containing protein n=1 Tax=Micromonospora sp. KC721 TaxID=2530380 RepID=UPI001FB6B15E|nr:PEP/pyruvate-binding domain-containing protein [Micromonospora sp. KC721]